MKLTTRGYVLHLPKRFYDDCVARGVPVPPPITEAYAGYRVRRSAADLAELIAEARRVADPATPRERTREAAARVQAALGLLKSLERQGIR